MDDSVPVLVNGDEAWSMRSHTCASSYSTQYRTPIDDSWVDVRSILYSSGQSSLDDAGDARQKTPVDWSRNCTGSLLLWNLISPVPALIGTSYRFSPSSHMFWRLEMTRPVVTGKILWNLLVNGGVFP